MLSGKEQRLTERMLKYWDLLKKEEIMPPIERFNPSAVEDLWQECFQVSVDKRHGINYRFEFMGESVSKVYGRDLTGAAIEQFNKQFPGVDMLKCLGSVATNPKPAQESGYFINEKGEVIKFRAIFLPFGTSKKGLSDIIVGLSFRAF